MQFQVKFVAIKRNGSEIASRVEDAKVVEADSGREAVDQVAAQFPDSEFTVVRVQQATFQ